VVARLGRGASADALLVTRSGGDEPLVLKIAIDRQHNDRINNEGEILKKLHDHNIVSLRDTLMIAGRAALLLDRAGEETLAQRMRKEPLSLDLVRRFGEELLSAVNYLEQEGVSHRDIKPENIGIARTGQKGQLRLILFDFSLARTPIDNIRAGTRRYLDPFLSLRRPPRWDLAAERYAVAVTLYEMVTGTVPIWGDGRSDAALLDCEATIDEERFDPQLRHGLSDFFGKAFRRDPKERFDNAEEMLRGWRHVFDRAHPTSIEAHEFSTIARAATADTSVRELGYSVEALNVLDRMGIQTVRQLLAVDRVKFRYLTNVGDRVRKQIRLRAKELALLRRDLARGQPSVVNGDEDRPAVSSIDRLAEQLLPRRPAGADLPEDRGLAAYLGMEGEFSPAWPTVGDASSKCDMSREALTSALVKARERWSKQPGITEVRNDLAILLNSNAGVLSAVEAASLLLAARGSVETDGAVRQRLSGAVVRAATEVEAALERPRYRVFLEHVPLIAVSEEAALYALELGDVADKLTDADPPFSPQKVLEALEVVRIPADVPPCAPQRLPKLATAVASRARLSSRGEIYPVGVGAEQAMRLALGALIGPDRLTVHELNSRIHGRFPEAAPLPDRPELDHLVEQVGIDLKWDETRQAYRRMTIAGSASGTPSGSERLKTEGPAVELTDDVINARAFEEKIAYAFRTGGFLALTCEPRRAAHAEQELLRRFPALEHINFDKLLVDGMTQEAKDKNVDWSIVLKTDAVGRSGSDWPNLLRLVALASPVIEHQLQTALRPVLLSRPGLIARYDLMPMMSRIAADAGTPGHIPLLLLLVPMAVPGLPSIDGTVVPVIGTTQWAIIPDAWVQNAHRAGTRAA
jgi:hypothetical protein